MNPAAALFGVLGIAAVVLLIVLAELVVAWVRRRRARRGDVPRARARK